MIKASQYHPLQNFPLINNLRKLIKSNPNDPMGPAQAPLHIMLRKRDLHRYQMTQKLALFNVHDHQNIKMVDHGESGFRKDKNLLQRKRIFNLKKA